MVWFIMLGCVVLEILRFENHKKLLTQHFLRFSNLSIPRTTHPNISKVYHFLDQFYEFSPLVPFIFVSWAPLKKLF